MELNDYYHIKNITGNVAYSFKGAIPYRSIAGTKTTKQDTASLDGTGYYQMQDASGMKVHWLEGIENLACRQSVKELIRSKDHWWIVSYTKKQKYLRSIFTLYNIVRMANRL